MRQIYLHYNLWEDFKNGMYNDNKVENEELMIYNAKYVLSNKFVFYKALQCVLKYWPNSIHVNLSNKKTNRQAWLGAAGCNYLHKCPEYITRIGWSILSQEQQREANKIADIFILKYEEKNSGIRQGLGKKMLF